MKEIEEERQTIQSVQKASKDVRPLEFPSGSGVKGEDQGVRFRRRAKLCFGVELRVLWDFCGIAR